MSLSSMIAVSVPVILFAPRRAHANPGVDDSGENERRSDEKLEPVRVPIGVDHALGGHAEDECAERRSHSRSITTSQKAAPHHRRGNVEKLLADACAGLQDRK